MQNISTNLVSHIIPSKNKSQLCEGGLHRETYHKDNNLFSSMELPTKIIEGVPSRLPQNLHFSNNETTINNIDNILDRQNISNQIKHILNSFDDNYKNPAFKKGIYIYGDSGVGKTHFVMKLLKEMNYDIIQFDAGDIRNKHLIESITSNSISKYNLLDMMQGKTKETMKKIIIVMDEVDSLISGDKGCISSLIKLIRQKKTKKQKLEHYTLNPIICIGNYYVDKKTKELMKVCHNFEFKKPTDIQLVHLLQPVLLKFPTEKLNLLRFIRNDLRKLFFVHKIYETEPHLIHLLNDIFDRKYNNEDSKKITLNLFQRNIPITEHTKFMNETDRTIVALLWHENIIDSISNANKNVSFPFYSKILENICYADYIDRITFQNQIWQFNEMSSLMKTFHTNKIYHDTFPENEPIQEIRFTKILTKFSTEYNNFMFIYNLCQTLDMEKKDVFSFFHELRVQYGNEFYNNSEFFERYFENTNLTKLDMKRIYKFLDKNFNKETILDDLYDDMAGIADVNDE